MSLRNLRGPAPRIVTLTGQIVVTAAGAILSQTPQRLSGVTFVKTGTAGQYVGTFYKSFKAQLGRSADFVGPAAGTPFPTTTGISPRFRVQAGTADLSSAMIQCVREDTQADADAASGSIINYIINMSETT
jgi:hypothetical protein